MIARIWEPHIEALTWECVIFAAAEDEKKTRQGIEKRITFAENLQKGAATCLEVVRTYQWKAVLAHKKTNCVTLFIKVLFTASVAKRELVKVILLQEAERWAADWDAKAAQPGFKRPAFFGVPISLKECIPLDGYDTTRGFAQDVGNPSKSDSVLAQQIKLLGQYFVLLDTSLLV
ncbi:hypothetical protein ANCDUO_05064 [Ancylostoma duodenale]|uniref:Amidase domain-containing protein n=1 Tax=Ancylostoma duodenale TaxID=51022 RepID=A0A0C2DPM0_9BILA|nr:hypothetical protein ANCDUO_05064 [Ancylostoma duodenale]